MIRVSLPRAYAWSRVKPERRTIFLLRYFLPRRQAPAATSQIIAPIQAFVKSNGLQRNAADAAGPSLSSASVNSGNAVDAIRIGLW